VTSTIDLARESTAEADVAGIEARSPLELFWRRLRTDRVAMVSLGFIVFLVLVAVCAPLIIKLVGARPPNQQSTKYLDSFGTPTGPSRHNIFGADPLGRDVFSRVLYGARVSLEVAIIATALSVFIGVVAGMLAGFHRGWVDTGISRAIDVLLAFPILLLALGLAAACSLGNGCLGGLIKPGLTVVIFVIAFVNWTYIARIIRGQVLSLREREFVEAARALGVSNLRILLRHIVPNTIAATLVMSSYYVAYAVIAEAGLSFIGMGAQPPTPSLGQMIASGRDYLYVDAWMAIIPGIAIALIVLGLNTLGDGLRDIFDPRLRRW
jgi:peptide/nickel transport system permease protein